MKKFLLMALLNEYRSQLQTALDNADEALREETGKVRRWNLSPLVGFLMSRTLEPTEDTPPDQWHWEDTYKPHPALDELKRVIARIGEFAESLGDKSDDTDK